MSSEASRKMAEEWARKHERFMPSPYGDLRSYIEMTQGQIDSLAALLDKRAEVERDALLGRMYETLDGLAFPEET